MLVEKFKNDDFHLFAEFDCTASVEEVESRLLQYQSYRNHTKRKHFNLGIHASIKGSLLNDFIQNWILKLENTTLFYFVHLPPHMHLSEKIHNYSLEKGEPIHVLPDVNLNYGRFKDELWDLHLEGFEIYFHHVDRVKSFTKDLQYFARLSNRGVQIGVSPLWQLSWLVKDNFKITHLINELSIHFFNTENIDVNSSETDREEQRRQAIIGMLENP